MACTAPSGNLDMIEYNLPATRQNVIEYSIFQ